MSNKETRRFLIASFLAIECVLYYFVLTSGGDTFTITAYSGIILCFLFAGCSMQSTPDWADRKTMTG